MIRKWFGYSHIPARFAEQVNAFNRDWLLTVSELPPTVPVSHREIDDTGRVRKRYRDADVMTPYEKLKSIEDADQCLAPGITFEALDAAAHALSDLEAAEALNRARADLFLSINKEDCAAA